MVMTVAEIMVVMVVEIMVRGSVGGDVMLW